MTDVAGTRWRWTIDRYQSAADQGWFGTARVELIDGEVFERAPMNEPHAHGVNAASQAVVGGIDRSRFGVGVQTPVRIGPADLPEPDLWVARGPLATYATVRPQAGDLVLVIEVSDSSLVFDRTVKVPRYAAAGIPVVWIVDVNARTVDILTEPDREHGLYRTERHLVDGDVAVVPEADVPVEVSPLFAPS